MTDAPVTFSVGRLRRLANIVRAKPWLIWCALLPVAAALFALGIRHEPLWFDEAYTAAMAARSLGDNIRIAADDIHAPLYHLGLRLFAIVFGRSEGALRLFSLLGALALVALGAGPIRRLFGVRTALCFSLLVIFSPIVSGFAQEARMYTWAAFFVTAAFVYGVLALRENRRRDWILLTLATLGAAYTHTYGTLAVSIIQVGLFVAILVGPRGPIGSHRGESSIRRSDLARSFAVNATACLVAFAPWFVYALSGQVVRVSREYWVPPVAEKLILGIYIYPFSNKFNFGEPRMITVVAASALVVVTIFGFIVAFATRRENRVAGLAALLIYWGVVVAGIAASILIRPVLVERYTTVGIGLLFLGAGYAVSSLGAATNRLEHAVTPLLLAVFIGLGIPQNVFIRTKVLNGGMGQAARVLPDQLQEGDVFIHSSEHTFGTFAYSFPQYTHWLYRADRQPRTLPLYVFAPNRITYSLAEAVGDRTRVWFVDQVGSSFGQDLADQLARDGWRSPQTLSFSQPYSWYAFNVRLMVRGPPSADK